VCITECCVGDFDWLALRRPDPPLNRLNLGIERLIEAVLNHLGVERAFETMSLLYRS
jgi:hypothetical protein